MGVSIENERFRVRGDIATGGRDPRREPVSIGAKDFIIDPLTKFLGAEGGQMIFHLHLTVIRSSCSHSPRSMAHPPNAWQGQWTGNVGKALAFATFTHKSPRAISYVRVDNPEPDCYSREPEEPERGHSMLPSSQEIGAISM
jgi:hypothetical protein